MNPISMLKQQVTLNHATPGEPDEFNDPTEVLVPTEWRGWLDTSGALRDSSEQVGQANWTTTSRTLYLRARYGGEDLIVAGLVSISVTAGLFNIVGKVQDHTDPKSGRIAYYSVTVDRTT